jgi:predicted nuclease of restriction endonuclease-like RecB superfamily
MAVRSREFIAENGHPRGMLGRHHSPETRSLLSQKGLERPVVVTDNERQLRSDRLAARHARGELSGSNTYSRCRRGKRPDLGDHFFRSSWEANYARYLNFLVAQRIIAKWEYEPDTFWFEAIKRGVRSYLPDFKVTEPNGAVYYVEVKGWMDAKSKTKLKRMKKYHPSVDLRLVDAKAYREISRKLGGAIPHWERAA